MIPVKSATYSSINFSSWQNEETTDVDRGEEHTIWPHAT